jgi:hypothetical protein
LILLERVRPDEPAETERLAPSKIAGDAAGLPIAITGGIEAAASPELARGCGSIGGAPTAFLRLGQRPLRGGRKAPWLLALRTPDPLLLVHATSRRRSPGASSACDINDDSIRVEGMISS